MGRDKRMALLCIVVASLAMASMATLQDDEKECADQLTNLASCIPYVSGTAPKPTPECCQDTQKVKANKPKCLCVLIKESTDPSMGLPVNTTLALQMPSACKIDASVSDCPSILNLPPGSPDAKIFTQAGSDSSSPTSSTGSPPSSASASSGKSSPSSSDSSSKSDSTTTTTSASSSSARAKARFFGRGMALAFVAWMFM